ncbi:hypothetical protein ACM66B_004187 [Microbotryomycetes sp. NB124-2]
MPVTVDCHGKRVLARRKSFIKPRSSTITDPSLSSSPPPSPTRKLRQTFGVGEDDDELDVLHIQTPGGIVLHDHQRHLSEGQLHLINPFKCPNGQLAIPPPPCIFPLSPPATVLNTPQPSSDQHQSSLLRRAPSLSRLLARRSTTTLTSDPNKSFASTLRRRSTTALFKLASSSSSRTAANHHSATAAAGSSGGHISPTSALIPPLCATSLSHTDLYRSQSDSRTASRDRDSVGPMWQRELGVLNEFELRDGGAEQYGAYALGLRMLMVTNPDEPDTSTDTLIGRAI